MSEISDVRRFDHPRKLVAYLGLVLSEYSTGRTTKRGGITKVGNGRVRRTLVEGAWTYRFPSEDWGTQTINASKLPPEIQDIAWKAKSRLSARHGRLSLRGKKKTVITTAIASELAAFMWDTPRTMPAP